MGTMLEAISAIVPSRWAFAAIGTAIDMNHRIAIDPTDARRSPYGRDFFVISLSSLSLSDTVEGLAILGAFLVVVLAGVGLLVMRRCVDGRS